MFQSKKTYFKHIQTIAIVLCVFAFIACKNTDSKSNTTTTKQPNIILFMVDDMGWQDTSVQFWKEKNGF